MNKDLIVKNTKKVFKGQLQNIVLKQIDDYFELAESNYITASKYKVGDAVLLNKNHLLHGIGKHNDLISLFAEREIVSQDYFGDNSNHAFCYESAFWNVKEKIKLCIEIMNHYYDGVVGIDNMFNL